MKFIQTIGLLALVAALTACNGGALENDAGSSDATSLRPADVPASTPGPVAPQKRQWLTDLNYEFSQKWEQTRAANAIVVGQETDAVNKQLDAEICKFANTLHVINWVGTIYELGVADNDDSKGAYLRLVLTGRGNAAVSLSSMLGADYVMLSSWMTDRGDNDEVLLPNLERHL